MSISVIIPSRTDSLVDALIDSLWASDPSPLITVVDNGLSDECMYRHNYPHKAKFVIQRDPFCFAQAVNKGIRSEYHENDILLLNDDTVMLTPNYGVLLQELLAAEDSQGYGIISLRIEGGCGNPDQKTIEPGWRIAESSKTICFIAVVLRRKALDQVGLLDETFTGYGWDDDDMCWRMREAGWKCGVTGLVTVRHGSPEKSMSSTYHRVFTPEQQRKNSQTNRDVFLKKWGKLSDPAHYKL